MSNTFIYEHLPTGLKIPVEFDKNYYESRTPEGSIKCETLVKICTLGGQHCSRFDKTDPTMTVLVCQTPQGPMELVRREFV